ncbi:S46 family peptidase [Flammeovirgaceae bacterium SG7u.111]|nr:S46 family peptidase [Flammeovirgaceae bacterium SG7u.132]WPO33366.1 S46 family peptidase [Flammeovirgaceae bacterium SG7u.111]
MTKKLNAVLLGLFLFLSPLMLRADEGMWLPLLLKQLNEKDMQAIGFNLTAEDLYSINKSSMKDAVVRFGGGCTGEMVSSTGLLLTNHHCGYGSIQSHSSVENDYLTDGFWAMNRTEELPTPGLTVTFIVRIEDVTTQVLSGIDGNMDEQQREAAVLANAKKVRDAAVEGTHFDAVVKDFFYGNNYYMFITETFKDVRLVGAPPSSIGKFGGDTDNWMWPRHTGDFSVFRIYADKNNQPADYSEDNIPYVPKYHFPISLKGVSENDFALIYGFPGRTQQYLPASSVDYVQNVANPAKIKMRETSLAIMDSEMKKSDEVRIKYASRYASISNYYKKWIGENTGLVRLDAIEKKKAFEKEFKARANTKKPEYVNLIAQMDKLNAEVEKYAFAREYFIELVYYGPQVINYAAEYRNVVANFEKLEEEGKLEETVEKLKTATRAHFRNYHQPLDKKLFASLLEMYFEKVDTMFYPEVYELIKGKYKGDFEAYTEYVFGKSQLGTQEQAEALLSDFSASTVKKLQKDPAFQLMQSLFDVYLEKIYYTYGGINAQMEGLMKTYVKARMELFPDKKYWPDANSTLRVGYGKVTGSAPRDGMMYRHYSTIEGIIQKHNPEHNPQEEFYVHQKLIDLYEKKNYGDYAQNGELWVCFTASNHTTGGNSGSPVINGDGQLIGINFDRSWESTMSDIYYDASRCRNIIVDIRYVLFVIDKFAGASHLVEEMTLVKE